MFKLENKVAIVTGAASGMGKAIAKLYAQEGAEVVVADYNFEGAVVALTKNSAFMYAKSNIRINGIAPGAIETNISSSMKGMSEFGMSRLGSIHSLSPRTGQPEEVAAAALFLGSDDASFVNGEIITVDGGWTAAF